MSKIKYVCKECGNEYFKWLGSCTYCKGELEEVEVIDLKNVKNRQAKRNSGYGGSESGKLKKLSTVSIDGVLGNRIKTGIKSLDAVFGTDFQYDESEKDNDFHSGITKSSAVLISGEPGIGKSTLMLGLSNIFAQKDLKIIYISGEENEKQVALRATRMGLDKDKIYFWNETNLEIILEKLAIEKPDVIIVDSIQTIFSSEIQSISGSVAQVRECSTSLTKFTKDNNITMFLIGHVSKDGDIAGPKLLEHVVDTILVFEGDKESDYRTLKPNKNRYGDITSIAVFKMVENGLQEVEDPSGIFLEKDELNCVGTAITATTAGKNSILLLEIQSLIAETKLPNPKRVTLGIENNRLSMILALLSQYTENKMYEYDVFINVISGFKIQETYCDVATFSSIVSSMYGNPIKKNSIMFGEIGLNGNLRLPKDYINRINVSINFGFENIFMPYIKDDTQREKLMNKYRNNENVKIIMCKDIKDLVKNIF